MALEFYRDENGNACARGRDDRLATFLQTDLQDSIGVTSELISSLKSETSHAQFNGNGHSVSIAPVMVVIESSFDDVAPDRRMRRDELLAHLEAWLAFISTDSSAIGSS